MNMPDQPAELLSLLRWYQAMGVDVAVGEEARDRFAESAAPPTRALKPNSAPTPAAPATPSPTHAAPARNAPANAAPTMTAPDLEEVEKLVQACETMQALREAYDAYDGCPLKPRATQLVFADGNPEANVMLIGEAPGHDEDLQGKPFVGRAGQLLDRMLGAIGLDRDKVFIVNTVAWRPPGNRNPTPAEIDACRPFLNRQVQLASPKLIMSLGLVATQTLFAEKISITRTRGQWRDVSFGGYDVPVLPTLHPAFLLRQPRQKREAWQDLLTLQTAIRALDGDKPD